MAFLPGYESLLYPMGVYKMALTVKHDAKLTTRLARIEGQVRGIARMVEEDRYCIDILNQMQAVKAALQKAEQEILKTHAAHCVAHAVKHGGAKEQQKKFDELVELFGRYGR
jgi:DNA-binding FrmR family transcriptional regulator